MLEPVVRLLAAVPSVIYGLIGILVLVPFVGNHLITAGAQGVGRSTSIQLTGTACSWPCVILTVMITPIMIAIIVDALRAVPRGWTEGAVALGVNRWRAMWTVSRARRAPGDRRRRRARDRPRARRGDHALDGLRLEGLRPEPARRPDVLLRAAAAARRDDRRQRRGAHVAAAAGQTLYAFALLLLVGACFLSLGGWVAKQPLKKYGMRA